MRNQLDKAIQRVMAARHAEHRRAAVLVILALLTILSVSWASAPSRHRDDGR